MSKIGILTFLHNENYGSTLQAWALQRVLRDAGRDAVHLDYRPDTREKTRNLLASGNSPALLLDGLQKRLVRRQQSSAGQKGAALNAFYARQMALSAPCPNLEALAREAEGFDALVCGSDQIWSPVWLNPAYFLTFAKPGQKRIAYACSLGVSAMPSGRKQRMIAELVRPFDAVSVRESEGQRILQTLLPDKAVDVLPDPVFLPGRASWLALAQQPDIVKPYVLCYFIGENPAYWQHARETADRLGAELRVIPVTAESFRYGEHPDSAVTPEQWVGWLAGAACVCTDSFHGAAFSAILGVPCAIERRYRDGDKASKNSRIDQLLREVGGDPLHPDDAQAERLERLRNRGLNWLSAVLNGAGL